jgi:pyruvate dehydrogenase E1 component beta subunit
VPESTADVAVNTPIAVILSEGEDSGALVKPDTRNASTPAQAKQAPAPQEPALQGRTVEPAYDASSEVPAGTEFVTMTVREALRDAMAERAAR